MADAEHVEIGYLEKCDSWKLESRFFPCKVGGKPAWLDLKNLSVNLTCQCCGKPCVFLCQIYAPVSGHSDHRMVYIFICRDPQCCKTNENGNFRAYRCQLPQVNEYYPIEDPVDSPDWHPEITVNKYTKTCTVCGAFGPHRCGKCGAVNYCSKEHQVIDWKSGHNSICSTDNPKAYNCNILFPESEILIEPEIMEDDEPQKSVEKSDEEKLQEYERLLAEGKGGTLQDVPADVIEKLALGKEDKYFKIFKRRLEICPDQILRYERGGKPLWISNPDAVDNNVPPCENCGAARQFEFQILSTLLVHLDVDSLDKSIDWGTLIIFTCANNCTEGPAYKQEFIWKQDVI